MPGVYSDLEGVKMLLTLDGFQVVGCRSFYVPLNPGHEGEAPDLTEAEAKELAWVLEFQNSVTKQKGEYWISVYDGECLGQDYTA